MKFDANGHLNAVDRSVAYLERDDSPATAVSISRSFQTTVDDLWDAVTSADRIPRWFLPVTGDLEPGGRYQLEGNAGGVITACEQLSYFALTWEYGDDVSWVEVRVLDEGAGRSRLTLTHTAHLSEHWDTYGPGAVGLGVGWDLGLLGLSLHLAHPDEPMPADASFATSPDGKAFITGSSDNWGQAAIASGTDPDTAAAAASHATAFYTSEPADNS